MIIPLLAILLAGDPASADDLLVKYRQDVDDATKAMQEVEEASYLEWRIPEYKCEGPNDDLCRKAYDAFKKSVMQLDPVLASLQEDVQALYQQGAYSSLSDAQRNQADALDARLAQALSRFQTFGHLPIEYPAKIKQEVAQARGAIATEIKGILDAPSLKDRLRA